MNQKYLEVDRFTEKYCKFVVFTRRLDIDDCLIRTTGAITALALWSDDIVEIFYRNSYVNELIKNALASG